MGLQHTLSFGKDTNFFWNFIYFFIFVSGFSIIRGVYPTAHTQWYRFFCAWQTDLSARLFFHLNGHIGLIKSVLLYKITHPKANRQTASAFSTSPVYQGTYLTLNISHLPATQPLRHSQNHRQSKHSTRNQTKKLIDRRLTA